MDREREKKRKIFHEKIRFFFLSKAKYFKFSRIFNPYDNNFAWHINNSCKNCDQFIHFIIAILLTIKQELKIGQIKERQTNEWV